MIVGLGNPGPEYRHTRHNLGWLVLEHAACRWRVDFAERHLALEASTHIQGNPVLLIRPLAWMNRIGPVVREILHSRQLLPAHLVVVYDDLDLPLGVVRIKTRGGAGGHNGVRSVLDSIESDEFCRMKVGIGRPLGSRDTVDYVLSSFSAEEELALEAVLDKSVNALECLIHEGPAVAMNRFHGRS
ncbi:MAG: aminoacyl-tRNA hydrolase [Nitrospirales bacterium]|nr:aminoacyl-tRNA hydrolase [Nitrospirales bacterium]